MEDFDHRYNKGKEYQNLILVKEGKFYRPRTLIVALKEYRGSASTSSYYAHVVFFSHAGRQTICCYCMLAFTLTANMVTRAVL